MKRHPPHRRDAGSTGRQWLPDPAFPAHKSTNSMTTPSRAKQSGLLSSCGLGFTIGTEKRKDRYKDADMIQKGSTVGSISGNVTITSDKDIHVNASDIIAGKDISMTGEFVDTEYICNIKNL